MRLRRLDLLQMEVRTCAWNRLDLELQIGAWNRLDTRRLYRQHFQAGIEVLSERRARRVLREGARIGVPNNLGIDGCVVPCAGSGKYNRRISWGKGPQIEAGRRRWVLPGLLRGFRLQGPCGRLALRGRRGTQQQGNPDRSHGAPLFACRTCRAGKRERKSGSMVCGSGTESRCVT